MQGRSNALKAFQYLESQGLVSKASSTPDLSHQCNPFQVRPPYPLLQRQLMRLAALRTHWSILQWS